MDVAAETKEESIKITNETDLTKLKFYIGMKVLSKRKGRDFSIPACIQS